MEIDDMIANMMEVADSSDEEHFDHRGGAPPDHLVEDPNAKKSKVTKNKIFVTGLPNDTTQAEMRVFFRKYGDVSGVYAPRIPGTNLSTGVGYVLYDDAASFRRALKISAPEFRPGIFVHVEKYVRPQPQPPPPAPGWQWPWTNCVVQ